eukprot:m.229481 g.229481  ORF g.229481 m.229481 type:complete len:277 (+) comp17753_c0_seq1:88-918(+)
MASKWPDSHNPTKAWEILQVKQKVEAVPPTTEPRRPDFLRLVCISDTHNLTNKLVLPEGDVLVHAGDFSNTGEPEDIIKFSAFLKAQPFEHKIVIAGNHDLTFDTLNYPRIGPNFHHRKLHDPASVKALLTGCTYLEDSGCVVDGVRFWGSPWQPEFFDWGFNEERGEPILARWRTIPAGVDVLMTHGPPIGHGDRCLPGGHRAGCVDLLREIQERIKPRVHVFGHIHEGYGMTTDGHTTYINASTCDARYHPVQPPIVFDVPKPAGFVPGLHPWA